MLNDHFFCLFLFIYVFFTYYFRRFCYLSWKVDFICKVIKHLIFRKKLLFYLFVCRHYVIFKILMVLINKISKRQLYLQKSFALFNIEMFWRNRHASILLRLYNMKLMCYFQARFLFQHFSCSLAFLLVKHPALK